MTARPASPVSEACEAVIFIVGLSWTRDDRKVSPLENRSIAFDAFSDDMIDISRPGRCISGMRRVFVEMALGRLVLGETDIVAFLMDGMSLARIWPRQETWFHFISRQSTELQGSLAKWSV